MPVHNLPYDRRLNSRAKHLRHEMTPQERKLWFGFLRDYPIKIYNQRVIEFLSLTFIAQKRNWSLSWMVLNTIQNKDSFTTTNEAVSLSSMELRYCGFPTAK